MQHLFAALAPEKRGGWAPRSEEVGEQLFARLAPGDVIMVKGSNGSRMGPVADALRRKLSSFAGRDTSGDLALGGKKKDAV
jgi:UDP-N-acetylmuramoyl-tripeptide--D-alanyl-D-alanine ligase